VSKIIRKIEYLLENFWMKNELETAPKPPPIATHATKIPCATE